MNIEKLKNEWFPLISKKELKNRPISKVLLGQKLVIFRIKNEIICLEDRLYLHKGTKSDTRLKYSLI